jgi:hypothetical protein
MQRRKWVLANRCAAARFPVRGVNTKVDRNKAASLSRSNRTLGFITNVPCDGTPQVALEIRRVKDKWWMAAAQRQGTATGQKCGDTAKIDGYVEPDFWI